MVSSSHNPRTRDIPDASLPQSVEGVIDLDADDLEMVKGEKDYEGWDCFLDDSEENYDVDVEMED
ncbi:hypothetical protein B0H14DRAFT_3496845 [Mycena olivaceomarginata]|nr:hypothetical protein B0H14DRAFT_3496845 [Mycena olivaceomarginata]